MLGLVLREAAVLLVRAAIVAAAEYFSTASFSRRSNGSPETFFRRACGHSVMPVPKLTSLKS